VAFDLASALKVIAESSKSAEIRGALYLASDDLKRLDEIRAAVRGCESTQGVEEKRAAWEKVKELCRVSESE